MNTALRASLILLLFLVPNVAFGVGFSSGFSYCRVLTATAGGNSNGIATTTTNGFALVATSTLSTLAATSSAGHIEKINDSAFNDAATSTPIDVAITDGDDCQTGGNLLDFYFESYATSTGEYVLWVEHPDIASSSPTGSQNKALMYYGDPNATDQSNEAGTYGGLGEVGVWNLPENPALAGTNGIKDSTSNSNDGTDNGSMTASDQVAGQIDGALDFDGTDDYVDADPTSLDDINLSSNPLTFSAWVKFSHQNSVRYLVNYFKNPSESVWIQVDSNDNISFNERAGGLILEPQTAATLNQWFHVVGVYDGSQAQIWINGILKSTDSTLRSSNCGSCGNILEFGTISTIGSDFYDGSMDDVRIYNRALSASEIKRLYDLGR